MSAPRPGCGEYGFGLLYEWLGASAAAGILGILVYRRLEWMWGLVAYVVYLPMKRGLPTPARSSAEVATAGTAN